ncbi:pseudouridine-5'-phosphate glycosidase [Escherichia coli]
MLLGKRVHRSCWRVLRSLTGGDSLKSNIQLVFNNAILASEIAKEYQRLVG